MDEKHGIHQTVEGRVMFGDAGISFDLRNKGYVCHLCTINEEHRTVDLALKPEHLEQIIEGARRFLGNKGGIKIETIWTERVDDDNPDLDWLRSKYDADEKKIVKSMRYSQGDIEQYGWKQVKEWMDEDNERLDAYGHDWCMMGIRAFARIQIPTGMGNNSRMMHTIHSSGLWGIESDSDDPYFKEVEDGELDTLKTMLSAMGIPEADIDRHIKVADHKNE
jgi:hypothetical protein